MQIALPSKTTVQNYLARRENHFYDGQQLTRREWQPYGGWDPPNAPPWMIATYSYDGGGNLTSEVRANYRDNVTTTVSYGWSWQGGAYRLTNFTATNGVTTTLDYDASGRIVRRYTALGYSDYIYEDGTDWLVRETWHAAQSGQVFDLVRYWYANGCPLRVEVAATSGDVQYVYGYNAYYIQYNWHGDAVTFIALDGSGGGSWGAYDPWGNASFWPPPSIGYYRWNGAWGYLRFDALNLYYVHGRWYSPDTGLFLSPDANGSYIYYDNDPVNKHADAPPPRANWPSECTPGFTNYDPRDLTCWLFREMKTNLNDPRLQATKHINKAATVGLEIGAHLFIASVATLNPVPMGALIGTSFISGVGTGLAGRLFYNQVADQRPWDFKHRIRDYLGPGITLCQSAGCQNNVEYSVPGNIHYGFVAREAGYDSPLVHLGAGVAEIIDPSHRLPPNDPNYTPYEGQVGCTSGPWCFGPFGWSLNLGDEPRDHQAVQFGIYLYDKYAVGRGLTFAAFQMELAKAIPHFAIRSPFPWHVPNVVARDWPYWPGYFDPTR